MVDMPLMAATAWAQAHAAESKDPVVFGAKVAQVYLAAQAAAYHAGDARATAAALAVLSVPVETLQALEQLCALLPRLQAGAPQTDLPGASGAAL